MSNERKLTLSESMHIYGRIMPERIESANPTLADVREIIAIMVERSQRGWIGEGEEIAQELLDYIDGKSPNTPAQWGEGIDEWAYIVAPDHDGYRGPFDSEQQAREFLATMPEHATPVSPMGPTLDRNTYILMNREEFKAMLSAKGTHD